MLVLNVSGNSFTLENDRVKFEFDRNGALKQLISKQTSRAVAQPGSTALWSVKLQDGSGMPIPELLGSYPAGFQLSRSGSAQKLVISWNNIALKGGSLSVTAEISLPDDSAIADWQISAKITGRQVPWIQQVTFPRLDALTDLGDDYLIYGEDYGRLVRDPASRMNLAELTNPGRWSMQFAAFFGSRQAPPQPVPGKEFYVNGYLRGTFPDDTGIFVAADDGENFIKSIRILGDRRKKTFAVLLQHYPELPFWPMSSAPRPDSFSYRMPYRIKLGSFNGGVGAATGLYRKMVKSRRYLKENHLTANRLEEGTFWAKFYFGANKAVPEILKMQQFLQVPVKTHWVRFGVFAFDNYNLQYLPSMASFRDGVRTLRQCDIGVAPYVCCAIWDQHDDAYHSKKIERAAALNEDLVPYLWNMSNPNSWMHPSSPLWQREYHELTARLFGQYGTNGQYLDVMACAGKVCFNSDLHRPNGGTYWADGNISLIKKMRRDLHDLNEESFLCSEGFSENYIGLIDYFLMLDLTRYSWFGKAPNDAFPLAGFIYHDKTAFYGSDCDQHIALDMLRWQMGLSFVWGVQLTYCDLDFKNPGNANDLYTRDLAQAWYQSGYPYLGSGVRMECAEVAAADALGDSALGVVSRPHRLILTRHMLNFPWSGPSVVSGAWKDKSGNIALTLANISASDQEISLRIDADKLGCSGKTLWRSWPLPAVPLQKIGRNELLKVTVPVNRAMILEIRDSQPEIRLLPEYNWIPVNADKNGKFPDTKVDTTELLGCDSAVAVNDHGTVSLRGSDDKPLQIIPVVWQALEGKGGPRGELFRTFHVLRPAGIFLHGDAVAAVKVSGDAVSGSVTVKKTAVLSSSENNFFAVDEKGILHYAADGCITLAPGKWRFAAVRDFAPLAKSPRPSLKQLAQWSQQQFALAEELLSGADGVAEKRRDAGENALAIANALTFAATGVQINASIPHDWLIAGFAARWDFAPGGGSLTLLNRSKAGELKITPDAGGFMLTLQSSKSLTDIFRLLYRKDIVCGGSTFTAGMICYGEAAYPISVQIRGRHGRVSISNKCNEVVNTVRVVNFSPVTMPVKFNVISSENWEIANLKQLPTILSPGETKDVKLHLKRSGAPLIPGKDYTIRIEVNHTSEKWSARGNQFVVTPLSFDLKPYGSGVAEPAVSSRIRYRTTLARHSADGKPVKVRVYSAWRTPLKANWKLVDPALKTITSGRDEIAVGSFKDLELKVPAPGTYIFQIEGNFFRLQALDTGNYAFCARENDPYFLFENTLICYFCPDEDAEFFEFSCADGGPSEPGRVTVWAPDDSKRFDYRGRYEASKIFRIPVEKEARGKIWCIRIEPEQDFSLRFHRGTSGWFSPEKESLLISK